MSKVDVDWRRVTRVSGAMTEAIATALEGDGNGAKKIEVSLAVLVCAVTTFHALLDTEDKAEAAAELKKEASWLAAEWAAGNIPVTVSRPKGGEDGKEASGKEAGAV